MDSCGRDVVTDWTTMSEEELREAIRANIENRGLMEGEYFPAEEIAADFPDAGMEDELLLGIIKREMTRHHILH